MGAAGHTGSVSQVRGDNLHRVAVSASYDKTIRVWGLEGKCRTSLTGHAAPILELESDNNGCLASGDRSGQVKVWDLDSATCTWELRNVHKGHVTAIAFADPTGGNSMWSGCFATGVAPSTTGLPPMWSEQVSVSRPGPPETYLVDRKLCKST